MPNQGELMKDTNIKAKAHLPRKVKRARVRNPRATLSRAPRGVLEATVGVGQICVRELSICVKGQFLVPISNSSFTNLYITLPKQAGPSFQRLNYVCYPLRQPYR